jgi:hypothetical protein
VGIKALHLKYDSERRTGLQGSIRARYGRQLRFTQLHYAAVLRAWPGLLDKKVPILVKRRPSKTRGQTGEREERN